jgi:hypothetical protein
LKTDSLAEGNKLMFRNDSFDLAMRLFVQAVSHTLVWPGLATFVIGAKIVTAPRSGSAVKPKPPQT